MRSGAVAWALVVAAAALGGCARGSDAVSGPDRVPHEDPLWSAPSEEARDDETGDALQAALERYLETQDAPGATAAVVSSEGAWVGASGGTATTVEEAIALEAAGLDAVVASGSDAGGHPGAFLRPVEESLVGTMPLVPQVVDAAWESGASALHKAALLGPDTRTTVLTRVSSGRLARGIRNRFAREMREFEADIPAYPLQNVLTSALRAEATRRGRSDLVQLWAGQAAALSAATDAAGLFDELVRGADVLLS